MGTSSPTLPHYLIWGGACLQYNNAPINVLPHLPQDGQTLGLGGDLPKCTDIAPPLGQILKVNPQVRLKLGLQPVIFPYTRMRTRKSYGALASFPARKKWPGNEANRAHVRICTSAIARTSTVIEVRGSRFTPRACAIQKGEIPSLRARFHGESPPNPRCTPVLG